MAHVFPVLMAPVWANAPAPRSSAAPVLSPRARRRELYREIRSHVWGTLGKRQLHGWSVPLANNTQVRRKPRKSKLLFRACPQSSVAVGISGSRPGAPRRAGPDATSTPGPKRLHRKGETRSCRRRSRTSLSTSNAAFFFSSTVRWQSRRSSRERQR